MDLRATYIVSRQAPTAAVKFSEYSRNAGAGYHFCYRDSSTTRQQY